MSTLDRMTIEEAGHDPVRLARAIHHQLGPVQGPVPVGAIARDLDIVEIRSEVLTNLEGALVTTPERGIGLILVNACGNSRRQRFTIAHELGHFLNTAHVPSAPDGFRCRGADLRQGARGDLDRHRRQEAEANAFAIELLAPERLFARYQSALPDLEHVLDLVGLCEVSREALARRYVSLHRERAAVLFCRAGVVRYADWNNHFPKLKVRAGDPLPELPVPSSTAGLSRIETVGAADWLVESVGDELTAQVLYQADGHATVLLHAGDSGQDEVEIEDVFERFSRFSRE